MNLLQAICKKNTIKLAIVLLMLSSACKRSEEALPLAGSMSIYNLSPTFATYDASINDLKVNTAAIPFGGGTKYLQLSVSNYAVKFNTAGAKDNVFTKDGLAITENAFSTLYLLGTPGNFEAIYVADNFENTTIAKTYVRFINLSSDAPALDLFIKDNANAIATNKTYKSYDGFVALEPGTNTLEIKETSSGTLKSQLESTNFAAGKFYTVISRGKVNPSSSLEHPFSGQIILHQ